MKLTGNYFSGKITRGAGRLPRHAPQHHKLSDVSQGIADRALNKLLHRAGQRRVRS
jgi:hypothetical protein